ncbi:DUF6415 family natural product biosynthesis protein [Streptomyces sp. NPDC048196]|uniref:DUF6415 family natural product biosynthesis protein n=1 Tax=Streptomyces sp. NPDC048196 TaxID=3154712 RepID=UPI0033C6AA9E
MTAGQADKACVRDATASAPSRTGGATVRRTIAMALRLGPPLPYDDLVALEQTLLVIIAGLWAAVDEAERESLDAPGQERRRARMEAIRHQTAVGLGDGLMSAQMQVRALARDCQWLLDQRPTEAIR